MVLHACNTIMWLLFSLYYRCCCSYQNFCIFSFHSILFLCNFHLQKKVLYYSISDGGGESGCILSTLKQIVVSNDAFPLIADSFPSYLVVFCNLFCHGNMKWKTFVPLLFNP